MDASRGPGPDSDLFRHVTGLADVEAALARGEAVVLPNPHPLTSVVAATTAGVVNTAKGRPSDQAVALWLAEDGPWQELAAVLDLGEQGVACARHLLVEERITALLPVTAAAPAWVREAARDGFVLVFGSCWEPLRPLLSRPLRVSSANRTGQVPVANAAAARAVFPPEVHVLADGDGLPATGRHATTTLRITRAGLTHIRPGAQCHAHGGAEAYLAHLAQTRAGVRALS
ncbi:tRNA A37 threonylcarbamoyladenosine synthetase subunit TsaC/SUA5/YrdC [Crossiella equi]|uniref:tRNA A37 threonylcarbamoyladenosine synthetase subunit TsaC/SUA5/YrdC n=1 Tax=Crossiella equi TaxID=130796 RepID=A0ABS5A507_9PSEU|nr:hypothetical protein [Crossiella equi]MBP2471324.1 tRNA A37 threonylcarbamoyladenosine synthetase subunit TsaC/SUA5/YrdC [Crossiella equi]